MNNEEYPLVSAIMLVGQTPYYSILSGIKCFKTQTYPYKELIIINNTKTQFEASSLNLKAEKDIFLLDTPLLLPAGAARNHGIAAANGQILAQFDANYWHAPNRLEAQIASMSHNNAHVSILNKTLNYSYYSGNASYNVNQKNAILNTMVYIRPSKIDYPSLEKGEEFGFLEKLVNANLKVSVMSGPSLACKIQWADNDFNAPININLSQEHFDLVKIIINDFNEYIK